MQSKQHTSDMFLSTLFLKKNNGPRSPDNIKTDF
jgi:hypothetical protein